MWIKLIPLVLGIIFLVVSMVIKYNVELRRSICTEQVSAVIAGVTKHNIYDSDGPDTEIYTPVYTMFMVEASIMCQAFLHVEHVLAIQSLYLSPHLILVYYITQRRTHVKSQLHSGP